MLTKVFFIANGSLEMITLFLSYQERKRDARNSHQIKLTQHKPIAKKLRQNPERILVHQV